MSKMRVFGVVLAASGLIFAGSSLASAAVLPLESAPAQSIDGTTPPPAGTPDAGSTTGSAAILKALATGSAGKPAPAPAP
ncbi:hypothetical protein [Nocardia sp. NPDC049149]|uniref:hypothetical protein n=1 Tax=Nocardia sp. NPDC049149 TaxID=3364315 RepID=UPI0037161E28